MRNDIEWITREKPTNLKEIKEFEVKCGYKFPKSYIDLMLKYNGAQIFNYLTRFNTYYESGKKFDAGFSICEFLAFGKDNVTEDTSLIDWKWEIKDRNYLFPEHLIPVIFAGGGNYVCFDYRHDPKTDNPRVVFWFHEEAGCLEEGLEVYFVANSFDEFLDSLFDDRTEEEKAEDEISRKKYLEMYGDK